MQSEIHRQRPSTFTLSLVMQLDGAGKEALLASWRVDCRFNYRTSLAVMSWSNIDNWSVTPQRDAALHGIGEWPR